MKTEFKLTVVTAILFSIYIILMVTAMLNLNSYAQVSAPLADKESSVTVVLDAGHGGEDGGAEANGIVEKEINLSITKKLTNLLRITGFRVKLTRSSDRMVNTDGNTLRERKISDMRNRLEAFNKEGNIVISIHQNKFSEEEYYGSQVFYSANNIKSSVLAESISNSIKTLIQHENKRECKPAGKEIYLLNNAKNPAVIVECGFISNTTEAKMLSDDVYQDKLAFAILTGFLEFYNNEVGNG